MKKYIATFFTHFYAIKFQKENENIYNAKLMPIPRNLYGSCGTCFEFETNKPLT